MSDAGHPRDCRFERESDARSRELTGCPNPPELIKSVSSLRRCRQSRHHVRAISAKCRLVAAGNLSICISVACP